MNVADVERVALAKLELLAGGAGDDPCLGLAVEAADDGRHVGELAGIEPGRRGRSGTSVRLSGRGLVGAKHVPLDDRFAVLTEIGACQLPGGPLRVVGLAPQVELVAVDRGGDPGGPRLLVDARLHLFQGLAPGEIEIGGPAEAAELELGGLDEFPVLAGVDHFSFEIGRDADRRVEGALGHVDGHGLGFGQGQRLDDEGQIELVGASGLSEGRVVYPVQPVGGVEPEKELGKLLEGASGPDVETQRAVSAALASPSAGHARRHVDVRFLQAGVGGQPKQPAVVLRGSDIQIGGQGASTPLLEPALGLSGHLDAALVPLDVGSQIVALVAEGFQRPPPRGEEDPGGDQSQRSGNEGEDLFALLEGHHVSSSLPGCCWPSSCLGISNNEDWNSTG